MDQGVIQTLGKYEIIAEQGRGGMGIVYKARDPIIGRTVALKTLTSEVAGNPDSLKRFYREAQAAGNLQHPNLVTIFDLGEASGRPYIAMEFVEGESLREIIAERPPMPLPHKLKIIRQFCSGLAYAHEHGLVHRDVKPANILVRKDGTAKVVDFGIVHIESTALTRRGMFLGTVQYASPEQLNERPVDQRSDIFSVGVVIYEFLSYQPPFDAPTVASVLTQILTKDPVPLAELVPGIPAVLEAIVARCLQKEPENRYSSLQDLILELDPLVSSLQHDLAQELVSQVPDLIARHDLTRARDMLRDALMLDSSHSQAKLLMNEVTSEIRRLELSAKVEALITDGQELLGRRDFEGAVKSFEEALKLDSHHEQAQALVADAREKRDQADQVRRSLTAAKNAYRNGDLTAAELTLEEVLQLDNTNSDAQAILGQIRQERVEREKRFRLRESLWEIRNLLERTRYEDATQRLADLQAEFPDEPEAGNLMVEVQQKKEEFRGQLKAVKALLEAGAVQEAVERAGTLAVRYRERPEAAEIYGAARRQLELIQRRRALGAAVAQIQQLIDTGKYAKALEECATAKEQFPEAVEIDRLAVLAKSQKLAADLEQQVQDSCRSVQDLLDGSHYDDAAAQAERELSRFPGSPELVRLLISARRGQFEAARQQAPPAPPPAGPAGEDVHPTETSIERIFAESKSPAPAVAGFETKPAGAEGETYSATQIFSAASLSALPAPGPPVQPEAETPVIPVEAVGENLTAGMPQEAPAPADETEAQPVASRTVDWLKPKPLLILAVILIALGALVWILRRRHAPPPQILVPVTISTSPAGATVSVDGRDIGASPVSSRLSPGTHQIAVSEEGYESASRAVDVAQGMTSVPPLVLTALPLKLQLDAGDMKNLRIKWDDEPPAPVTGGQWSRDVETGAQPQTHTLEVKAGGASGTLTIEVTAGAAPRLTFGPGLRNLDVVALMTLDGKARAQFSSVPGKASIDGQPYDLTAATPALQNLSGATHELSWDDGTVAVTKQFQTGPNPAAAIFLLRPATLASKTRHAKSPSPPQPPAQPSAALELKQKIDALAKKAYDAEQAGNLAEPDQDNAIFYANQVLQLDSNNSYASQILKYSTAEQERRIGQALANKDYASAKRMADALVILLPGNPDALNLQKTAAAGGAREKPLPAVPPTPVFSEPANLISGGRAFWGTVIVVGRRLKFVWSPGPGPQPPQVDLSCSDIKEVKQDRTKGRFHVTTRDKAKYEFESEQATGKDVQSACAKP